MIKEELSFHHIKSYQIKKNDTVMLWGWPPSETATILDNSRGNIRRVFLNGDYGTVYVWDIVAKIDKQTGKTEYLELSDYQKKAKLRVNAAGF